MRRAGLIALVVLAVAGTLAAIWAAGAQGGEGTSQEDAAPEAEPARASMTVEADGAAPAYEADPDGFAAALAAYLGASGGGRATVVQPAEDGPLYALCGGTWLECRSRGAGWAFAVLDGVPDAVSGGKPPPAPVSEPEPEKTPESTQGAQEAGKPAARDWRPLSEAAGLIGQEAASGLDTALAGWAASKGIAYAAGSAQVDAGSVRDEPGGVGFAVAGGGVVADVVYTAAGYGFLLLE